MGQRSNREGFSMEIRRLGSSELRISALAFGTMTFGDGSGKFGSVGNTHGDSARSQIDRCLDRGVNLFDTAGAYSAGQSEEILGEALGDRRGRVLIATKVFGRTGSTPEDCGLGRRHVMQACEASLRRLGTDWIDLYQVHSFDSLVPVEETLQALEDLVRAGKIRYVGCSNLAGWQLMKALGVSDRLGLPRHIGQQIQYSLLVRDAEQELLPAGVDQGVGALIWGPLAQGYLSGKFAESAAGTAPTRLAATGGIASRDTERGRRIVGMLREVAAGRGGVSPAQVAINWVRSRAGVSTVIVGARSDAQLADNLAAADWSLAPDEIRRLDYVSQTEMVYPNSFQRTVLPERNPQLFPRYDGPRER
jgi:aryl-alcohol dehydrogenase-like predicted oxidoreductase